MAIKSICYRRDTGVVVAGAEVGMQEGL